MSDDDTSGLAASPRGTRSYVQYSAALGRAICARVAAGESVAAICEDAGMPDQGTVVKWARMHPAFGQGIARARLVAERLTLSGSKSSYDPAAAQLFYERVCEGESVLSICRDPTMPSYKAFFCWRKRFPEFADMMAEARAIQAERFCDLGWEIAEAVTPKTAYATQVKLGQLRWTAGMLAPRRYGRTRPVELEDEDWPQALEAPEPAPAPKRPEMKILIRSFQVETHPETGQQRTVGYCPNPETGRVERTSEGPWCEAPDPVAKLARIEEIARLRKAAAERGGVTDDPEGAC